MFDEILTPWSDPGSFDQMGLAMPDDTERRYGSAIGEYQRHIVRVGLRAVFNIGQQ